MLVNPPKKKRNTKAKSSAAAFCLQSLKKSLKTTSPRLQLKDPLQLVRQIIAQGRDPEAARFSGFSAGGSEATRSVLGGVGELGSAAWFSTKKRAKNNFTEKCLLSEFPKWIL